jgi:antitoxin MazE
MALSDLESLRVAGRLTREPPNECAQVAGIGLNIATSGYTLDIRGGPDMVGKIQKWGNSQGLRLPKHVLDAAGISVGDDVEVTTNPGEICLVKKRRVRGTVDLQKLVDSLPEDYVSEEVDWGEPRGKEIW